MKFKNWLILNEEETKNIVQGPILLYHATSTGEDNKTLNSFKNEGAKPMMGGGYGQGRGLYMMSLKGGPYSHAKKLAAERPANPAPITKTCLLGEGMLGLISYYFLFQNFSRKMNPTFYSSQGLS